METVWNVRRPLLVLAGLLGGTLASAVAGGLAGASPSQVGAESPAPFIEATHLPPLLTLAGEEPVLRYDVYCDTGDPPAEDGCAAAGSVFVRPGDRGRFREVPLSRDPGDPGRYLARIPTDIAGSRDGFTYYAVVRAVASNVTATIPEAGALAPERSLPLGRPVAVGLGAHAFGAATPATARVADAAWGDGADDVGLEQGRNLTPIGGSSFDVTRDGTVVVLDEAHRRLLRFRKGMPRVPAGIPVAINGTIADLGVGDDGSSYVLETAAADGGAPLVRRFAADGRATGATPVAGRASQLRPGSGGSVALDDSTSMWMPVFDAGAELPPDVQRRRARPGRPLSGGDEVVVLRTGDEVRAALVGSNGVRRSWRVTSETPIAEVQLAEPLGVGLVLVFRVYTDSSAEFVALVLGPQGVERRLSLDANAWAEGAPLSRFRLAGSSLYRLGSTPEGLYVDRFDLEVK